MCMCVYNYVLTPTIHAAVSVLSVHRSTTRNTPWTRPAARHRTSLLPRATIPRERSIHISAVGSSVVHGISTFSFLSLLDCSPRSFFFRLLCVWLSFSLLDTLLFRILRVIGSKVNRSKVIFSSRSLSSIPRERSVSCLSPFFILANRASFFHVILSPFSSHLYPSTSLSLFYSAESLYKFEKDDARTVEKSIDGNWSATHSTVDKLDRTCWGCEFKLKVPLILGEIFVNRWRTCSTKLYVLTFLINYVWQ